MSTRILAIIIFSLKIKIIEVKTFESIAKVTEYTQVIVMILIFVPLMYYLRYFYKNEFKQNVRNMVFFFAFEVSFSGLLIISNFNIPYIIDISRAVIATGSYPIQQALCLIYLKRTRDPLHGISKLDFIHILSIT